MKQREPAPNGPSVEAVVPLSLARDQARDLVIFRQSEGTWLPVQGDVVVPYEYACIFRDAGCCLQEQDAQDAGARGDLLLAVVEKHIARDAYHRFVVGGGLFEHEHDFVGWTPAHAGFRTRVVQGALCFAMFSSILLVANPVPDVEAVLLGRTAADDRTFAVPAVDVYAAVTNGELLVASAGGRFVLASPEDDARLSAADLDTLCCRPDGTPFSPVELAVARRHFPGRLIVKDQRGNGVLIGTLATDQPRDAAFLTSLPAVNSEETPALVDAMGDAPESTAKRRRTDAALALEVEIPRVLS